MSDHPAITTRHSTAAISERVSFDNSLRSLTSLALNPGILMNGGLARQRRDRRSRRLHQAPDPPRRGRTDGSARGGAARARSRASRHEASKPPRHTANRRGRICRRSASLRKKKTGKRARTRSEHARSGSLRRPGVRFAGRALRTTLCSRRTSSASSGPKGARATEGRG